MEKQIKMRGAINSRPPKRSLNSCLLVLGASVSEVHCPRYVRACHKRGKSIYERYTVPELRTWAKSLFRESIKNNHHDITGDDRQARNLIEAYRRAIKILAFK